VKSLCQIRLLRAAALVVVLGLGAAACGDDSEVGSGVDTEFDQKVGNRLGVATSTTAAGVATTVAPVPTTAPTAAPQTTVKSPTGQAATATTVAPTTTAAPPTTAAAVKTQDVKLDGSGFEFNPIRLFAGTPLRFFNVDSETRSVQGTKGEFDSGPIAPGAEFTIVLNTPGDIQIEDGTRPFVTSKIEVRARR